MSAASSSSLPSSQRQYTLKTELDGSIDTALVLNASAPIVAPAKNEVVVRVRAVSLNFRDLLVVKKQYPFPTKKGAIPASDGAGEIVAIGSEVKQWKVGDRVAAIFTPSYQGGAMRSTRGLEGSLGGDIDGVLTQYRTIEETALVRVPNYMSFEEAATLPCAGVTAYNALYSGLLTLRPDHVVLVQGTGGVSILAAQIALAAGARVIITSSSDEKLARVTKQLNIPESDQINYKKTPEWGEAAKKLTGGVGVDHVIEVGGQGTIQQSLKAIRLGGEIDIIGFVGGVGAGEGVNPLQILGAGATVRAIMVGSREHFTDLMATFERAKVKPIVDRVFPFDQAIDAYKYLESQAHFGKVVIRVD